MNSKKYLSFLKDEIHTAVFATVDEKGLPHTSVADIAFCDEESLYFITAKGTNFYQRLCNFPFVSASGFKNSEDAYVSVTIKGEVKELDGNFIEDLLKKNSHIAQMYLDTESHTALTVFKFYKGTGEFFQLSCNSVFRESFSFGGAERIKHDYYITDKCVGCHNCAYICPQKCIDTTEMPVFIIQKNCIHCGKCYEICPVKAISKS